MSGYIYGYMRQYGNRNTVTILRLWLNIVVVIHMGEWYNSLYPGGRRWAWTTEVRTVVWAALLSLVGALAEHGSLRYHVSLFCGMCKIYSWLLSSIYDTTWGCVITWRSAKVTERCWSVASARGAGPGTVETIAAPRGLRTSSVAWLRRGFTKFNFSCRFWRRNSTDRC